MCCQPVCELETISPSQELSGWRPDEIINHVNTGLFFFFFTCLTAPSMRPSMKFWWFLENNIIEKIVHKTQSKVCFNACFYPKYFFFHFFHFIKQSSENNISILTEYFWWENEKQIKVPKIPSLSSRYITRV